MVRYVPSIPHMKKCKRIQVLELSDHFRTELRQAAGKRWGDLSYMLGGYSERKDWKTGRRIDGDKEKWKPNHDMVKVTINFLQLTRRMKGSYEGA